MIELMISIVRRSGQYRWAFGDRLLGIDEIADDGRGCRCGKLRHRHDGLPTPTVVDPGTYSAAMSQQVEFRN